MPLLDSIRFTSWNNDGNMRPQPDLSHRGATLEAHAAVSRHVVRRANEAELSPSSKDSRQIGAKNGVPKHGQGVERVKNSKETCSSSESNPLALRIGTSSVQFSMFSVMVSNFSGTDC